MFDCSDTGKISSFIAFLTDETLSGFVDNLCFWELFSLWNCDENFIRDTWKVFLSTLPLFSSTQLALSKMGWAVGVFCWSTRTTSLNSFLCLHVKEEISCLIMKTSSFTLLFHSTTFFSNDSELMLWVLSKNSCNAERPKLVVFCWSCSSWSKFYPEVFLLAKSCDFCLKNFF